MIRLNNIKIPPDYNDSTLKKAAARELRLAPGAIQTVSLFRRSVDARKKDRLHFICSLDVTVNVNENTVLQKAKAAVKAAPFRYDIPSWRGGARPVIAGFGPAGMFAALVLARSGAAPIVIERGKDVDSRTADVHRFWHSGILDEASNVQFGEGGAGTFSDGKLNTGTKDVRQRWILQEFAAHGAPEEILYNAMPHIGTDKLKITVRRLREEIIALGGTVLFETKLSGLRSQGGQLTAAVIEKSGRTDIIETDSLILAVGHSARDTFEMLQNAGLPLEAKSFSVGVRIEHLREKIDRAQYGSFAGHPRLGAAYYKMNVKTANGRGAYTFCMCPGGSVVNASSEPGRLCTNGMSEFARDAQNSNAALLVGVTPDDFGSDHPLAGMYFQRALEEKAFAAGGGCGAAPVQRAADFLCNQPTVRLGDVTPSVLPQFALTSLHNVLPAFVIGSMQQAITEMGKKLKGFDDGDALLTGAETRSSSPVRILRSSETLQSAALKGLYPCGEGAGYAGGIMSAATDGIKCAEKIIAASRQHTFL